MRKIRNKKRDKRRVKSGREVVSGIFRKMREGASKQESKQAEVTVHLGPYSYHIFQVQFPASMIQQRRVWSNDSRIIIENRQIPRYQQQPLRNSIIRSISSSPGFRLDRGIAKSSFMALTTLCYSASTVWIGCTTLFGYVLLCETASTRLLFSGLPWH